MGMGDYTYANAFCAKQYAVEADFDGMLFSTADQNLVFNAYYSSLYDGWGGIGLSRMPDRNAAAPSSKQQFSVWADGGANGTETYAVFYDLSRPEKGLQKRVNLMQQTTNSDLSRHYLPRQLRHLILQEYLSGVKTARQLSEEHGIPMSTIHKMGQRWKAKNSCSFVSTPNPYPIMSRVTSEEASELLSENKALRRRLEEALLRLEGYEIMGDILQEEYGIDLLKKSAAGQSSVSKKDTQQ